MTVSATIRRTVPYPGDGVQDDFDFDFVTNDAEDLIVIFTDDTGEESVLVLNDDYTVALNPDQGTAPGGTVTTVAAAIPATGEYLTIVDGLAASQAVPLSNVGPFLPATIEAMFDKLAMLVRQTLDRINESVRVPRSAPMVSHEIQGAALEADRAGKALMFNADGDGLVAADLADAGALTVTTYAESLLDDADATAARATLGLSDPLTVRERYAVVNTPAVIGAQALNNSGSPNTQLDIAGLWARLVKPSSFDAVVRAISSTITCDVNTAGPAVNGRDQAGAFSANSWVHFYLIWNGTTLASVASASAPPTGPTLPSGYTHWAYVGAVRFNGSSQLTRTTITGSRCRYEQAVSVLASGTATSETVVPVAAAVPPNALEYSVQPTGGTITADGSGVLIANAQLRQRSGFLTAYAFNVTLQGLATSGNAFIGGPELGLSNIGQQFYYLWQVTNGSSPSINIGVNSYVVPNGG